MFSKKNIIAGFFIFAVPCSLFSSSICDHETYIVKKGDTLSGILYNKGVVRARTLYGRDGWVEKNKDINQDIKVWEKLMPGTSIKIIYPSKKLVDVSEQYTVEEGDILSELLFDRGVVDIKSLYGEGAYVQKNKEINPNVVNWEKIAPGTIIKLVYPGILKEATPLAVKYDAVESKNENYVDLEKIKSEPESGANPENVGVSNYFLEHRFMIGVGIGYDDEEQLSQTIVTKGRLDLPVFQYQMIFRPSGDPNIAAWESSLFIDVYRTNRAKGVSLPLSGQIELGFGRYSLFKFSNTRFNPQVSVSADVNNNISADATGNFIYRNKNILWFGFKPEFESFIGGTTIECVPFVYKSFFVRSMGESLSAWKFGLKTNIGLAFKNALFGSIEYNYQRFSGNSPVIKLTSNNLVLGLGYKF